MSSTKVWFITGASRGMGSDFAKAALAAGHAVVATGRDRDRVSKALGQSSGLLSVTLDVTSRADAEAAVQAAVERFGRIDVLVNNAASFYAGYFEELTPEQVEQQLATSLLGPMNVTRAVLPVMRQQRAGHIISISSSAGIAAGFDFVTAYAASKFGLEGWMESLSAEIAPFGIHTTIVNPGFFRTELLTEHSTSYAAPSIADYDERRGPLVELLEVAERPAGRRPCEAGARAPDHRRTGAAAAPLHRWRGRHRRCGAEAPRPEGSDRVQPDALDVPRIRLGVKQPGSASTRWRHLPRLSPARRLSDRGPALPAEVRTTGPAHPHVLRRRAQPLHRPPPSTAHHSTNSCVFRYLEWREGGIRLISPRPKAGGEATGTRTRTASERDAKR